MKFHLSNYTKDTRIIIALVIIFIIPVFSSACTKKSNTNKIICNSNDYSLYSKVLEEILPLYTIEQADNNVYFILDSGAIPEVFDTQAVGALETKIAKYWYPQYLATVIIAIDRDKTNAIVTSWNDLFKIQQEVGLFNTPGNIQMLTAAMSYGLEGEGYSLTRTMELLALLYNNNQLKINSFETPIIISYDYEAATLIENGRNMEIVIPIEGTFTYEKGLLSNEPLNFQGNLDRLLLDSNLRLLNGESDLSIYPNEAAYGPAIKVDDYKYFARITQNSSPLMERKVLHSKTYMSIDNREHLLSALTYIIIVTIWIVSILKRSMQKGISYAAFFTGIILIGWTFFRLIKYQIELNPILVRYLWYGYYIFQLTLPLVLLWMAWAIDKPENETFPPKWWQIIGILISILILLVFTNDLHGLVLDLDLSRPDWGINYGYGLGYYTILFVCMLNLLGVFIILLKKGIRNSRKKIVILPFVLFFMFGLYNYKYITRDPFIYATDLTIITGLFTLLMFESCIRSGLIPVNTKYIDLFKESPLKMQIINVEKEVVFESTSARPLDKNTLDKAINSSPIPILKDDSLLFANSIPGGYATWHDDISNLHKLQREIKKSTKMLAEANAILIEEEKLKRSINEEKAKNQLMNQLEGEIAKNIEKLTKMIEELPKSDEHLKDATRIALLLCYIKRRCNFFFQEKESDTMNLEELTAYIDELAEIAKNSSIQIAAINKIKGRIPIRQGTVFYDSFYTITDLAVKKALPYTIEHLEEQGEFFNMRFLLSEDIDTFKLDSKLAEGIEAANGKLVIKDLEDTVGINISFPKGGVAYD